MYHTDQKRSYILCGDYDDGDHSTSVRAGRPFNPARAPPLKSGIVVSRDGKMKYTVVIRDKNETFPDTKSVLADRIEIDRVSSLNTKRRLDRVCGGVCAVVCQ